MNADADALLMAIDCGTQSVRALLFDLRGELVAKSQLALDGYTTPHPGWHEHDADALWQQVAAACRQLWLTHGQHRARVRGLAVTTQRGTIMPIDADGRALAPAITWLDQRKAARVPPIGPLWNTLFRVAGASRIVRHLQREAEANWWAAERPDLWARCHKLLLVSGWIHFKLTGRLIDSAGSQVAYLPFDFKRLRWAAASDWKWQAFAVRREQLPELAAVGEPMGSVSAEGARATGIPEGLPLIAGAADKACEVLGSGCVAAHQGALSYGTTATINVCTPRYVEALPLQPAYSAAMPRAFNAEVQIFRGFWMVRWFKEQFAQVEQQAASREGVSVETLLDKFLTEVPAGSMGLVLQPYWSPGLRVPGPDAKGAVIGFGDVHTRAHLYRATIEGLAYALREGRERIERKTRTRVTELRVSGGGSQSDGALQLTADIFALPTDRPHTYETAGLGAAIACAVGLKLHPSFAEAVGAMTRVVRTFEPLPANVRLYDELYRRVYRRMYDRLTPLYADIQRITGYPKLD